MTEHMYTKLSRDSELKPNSFSDHQLLVKLLKKSTVLSKLAYRVFTLGLTTCHQSGQAVFVSLSCHLKI